MSTGELLTRGTIWLALCGYAAGASMLLLRKRHPELDTAARWAWTIGCAFFVAHVISAFSYYHGWSHAAAYEETARQTGQMTGIRWGGGLFLNYLLAAAWIADVISWWSRSTTLRQRAPLLFRVWHGFFFFMVFNGAIVFAEGPVRWIGALICGTLVVLWWRTRRDPAAPELSRNSSLP